MPHIVATPYPMKPTASVIPQYAVPKLPLIASMTILHCHRYTTLLVLTASVILCRITVPWERNNAHTNSSSGLTGFLFGYTTGMLFGLVVHAADVQDRDGAPAVLKSIRHACPWLRHLFADGGYAGPKLRGALDRIGKWTLEIVKRSDTAKSLPPRRRGASKSSPDDGSSNAPLHGSGAADGWQKTGKNPSPPARRGSTSPISDSQPGGSQGLGRLEGVSSQALRA